MMSESLDTSVLLRLITRDNEGLYQRAVSLLGRRGVRYQVADLVLMEVVYVLTANYEASREKIAEVLEMIMAMGNVNCNEMMLRPAVERYKAHLKLSFVDCCLAEYARLNEAEPLWTFDRKLARQSGVAKEVTE